MKKQVIRTTLITLCAAALFIVPSWARAQDSTNAPTTAPAPAPEKKHSVRYHGNLAAVDTNAMTLSVGDLTLQVTSKTKISKDGQAAVLGDGVVGQPVSGSYRIEDGATNAVSVHFGAKKKKQSADTSGS
jgi:hypothetical protein